MKHSTSFRMEGPGWAEGAGIRAGATRRWAAFASAIALAACLLAGCAAGAADPSSSAESPAAESAPSAASGSESSATTSASEGDEGSSAASNSASGSAASSSSASSAASSKAADGSSDGADPAVALSITGGVQKTVEKSGQDIEGDILVDEESSLDLYLLKGSTWTGAGMLSVPTGSDAATTEGSFAVSIDSSSTWVVTDDSTVSSLTIAKGGNLADQDGKGVKILDADGNTLVDGASDVQLTVTGAFSSVARVSR